MSYSPHVFGIVSSGVSQAGKFILTNSNGDVEFPYGDKVQFGNDVELQVYHDGLNSYITSSSGLKIGTESSVPITIGNSTSEVTVADNLTVTGDFTVNGTTTSVNQTYIDVTNAFVFEGSSANAHETTLGIVDPTADATINLPAMGAGTYYLPVLAAASTTSITSTPAELNILDGVTATATELNYLDITTLGTAENSKAFTRKGDGTATFAGTTIADLGTVTTADINGGSIDGAVIGANSPAAGTFAAIVGTSLSLTEGNITNVGNIALDSISADGSALSIDSNWDAAGVTCSDLGAVTTVDINGGTIDGANIGVSSQGTGAFTTLSCNAGALAIAGLNIDGGTDIGEAIADTDLFIIDNGADGTNRKCAASRLKTYVGSSTLTVDTSFSDGETIGSSVSIFNESSDMTINLPASHSAGDRYYIKNRAASNILTVGTADSDTIDGGGTKILYHQYEAITVISDGTNWHTF